MYLFIFQIINTYISLNTVRTRFIFGIAAETDYRAAPQPGIYWDYPSSSSSSSSCVELVSRQSPAFLCVDKKNIIRICTQIANRSSAAFETQIKGLFPPSPPSALGSLRRSNDRRVAKFQVWPKRKRDYTHGLIDACEKEIV